MKHSYDCVSLEVCNNNTFGDATTRIERLAVACFYDEHDNLTDLSLVHTDTYTVGTREWDSHKFGYAEGSRDSYIEKYPMIIQHIKLTLLALHHL